MSEKKLVLTDADKHALERMPEDWFSPASLPHTVRCPMARCKRLEERGELQRRAVGTLPFVYTEFKKKEPQS